jgi:hypothetical protein
VSLFRSSGAEPARSAPWRRAAAAALLVTLLAGCGAATTQGTPTTAPTGPDAVATAFAAAYAGGDTSTACSLATGTALAVMTNNGWCAPHAQPWPAVSYWPGTQCVFPDELGELSSIAVYGFHTSGEVAQAPDFVIQVATSGATWQVTLVAADGPDVRAANWLCSRAEQASASTGPTG